MRIRSASLRQIAAIASAVLVVAGCSSSPSRNLTAPPREVPIQTLPTDPPVPSSPGAAFLLLDWCWAHRDSVLYSEVFSGDFRSVIALPDSAGNAYRAVPWTLVDELASAARIFASSSFIGLSFGSDLAPSPDPRPGKTWPWHQEVRVTDLALTILWNDGSVGRASGVAVYYVVRGDSAVIAQELIDRGFKPDVNRWYIEGWDDQTGCGGTARAASAWAARPARSLPAECTSWGRIKLLYR